MLDFEEVLGLYLKETQQYGIVEYSHYEDADFKYGVYYDGDSIATEDILAWFDDRLRKIEKKLTTPGD